jgi:hypothetical protein
LRCRGRFGGGEPNVLRSSRSGRLSQERCVEPVTDLKRRRLRSVRVILP